MKTSRSTLFLALAAVACLPAIAAAQPKPPTALPQSSSLRAVACAATLTAMAGSVRPTSAAMADELAGISAKWRAQAKKAFAASGQAADLADAQIAEQTTALTSTAGLPGGTFEKAQTCQNEGGSLPAG